jgi:hypothetical protein
VSTNVVAVAARPRPKPEARPRPQLRVAPDLRRRRRRARIIVAIVCIVTVASLFTLVAFHVFAAQSAFTLDELSKERENEQLRYERLREEVARQSSPEAVIAAARALGMVPADRTRILDAPEAAPTVASDDPTQTALSPETYDKTKRALDANP